MGITEAIARWITTVSYESVPPEAVEATRRAILDTLGVALVGATQPVGQIVLEYTREAGGTPETGVIGGNLRTSLANAAFANGVLAHATDFDDTWLPLGHPSCTVLPVVLALGEKLELSGQQLVAAFVVGLEVHGKIGFGRSTPGFHSTGTHGALAAAAAAARLLVLDPWQTRMALAIAASHASGIGKNNGTMTKPYHAGNAAAGGLRAALLARSGFTGDPEPIVGQGYAEAFMGDGNLDVDAIVGSLGNPFHIVSPGLGFKKYPTCYLNHRALDALLSLVESSDIRPEQVEEVVVSVPHDRWLNRSELDFGLRSKFSLQYNVAEAVLARRIVVESFDDAYVQRAEVREMMQRVRLEVDPDMPVEYAKVFNPVMVRLKDGRVLRGRVDVPHGDWDDPLSLEELVAKYRDNALRVLFPDACQRTIDLVLRLDELDHIGELVELYTYVPSGVAG